MNKDRITQLVAVGILLAALVGSTLMIDPVVRTRRDLQLTFAVENNQGEPPQYALLAAGLGSFRGVAVNALWYRMEMMKRDGQFAEANTLATWISNLQPRFPHVWGFLAWNMAYNISVETFTPQERYDWVNKGVKLLREQGIPYNPNSVRLYRELAWILSHKMGQFTDDVNWYYKGEFAREWETVLGAAAENMTGEGVTAEFANVAEMADRYFTVDRPNRAVSTSLDAVLNSGVVPGLHAESLPDADRMSVLSLENRLRRAREELSAGNTRGRAALDAVLELTATQLQRARRDATAVFLEDYPDAAAVAQGFREEGFALDGDLLRAVGQCLMYLRFRAPETVMSLPDSVFSPESKRALPIVYRCTYAVADTPEDRQVFEGIWRLVFFLRARVLVQEYRMQPLKMLAYMERYGPLDWRNVTSHALYWSRLGVEQYRDLRDNDKVDVLNTQRGVIHALQGLVDFGTVSFNPTQRPGQQIDLLPDPDFIDGYFVAIEETKEAANAEEFGRIRAEAFANGEENFLQKAVLNSWLYGNPAQAMKYFSRLAGEFADSNQNRQYGWYELGIEDFVAMLIFDDDLGRPGMTSLINAKLVEAFYKGLTNRRGQVFARNLALAREVHGMYNQKYDSKTGLGVDDQDARMRLKPFNQMVFDAFTAFMQDRKFDFYRRVSAYQTAWRQESDGMPLAPETYDDWIAALRIEAAEYGVNPDAAFPQPVSLDTGVRGVGERQGGETVEQK